MRIASFLMPTDGLSGTSILAKCLASAAPLLGLTLVLTTFLGPGNPSVKAGTAIGLGVVDLVECAEVIVEGQVLAARPFLSANDVICTEYDLTVDRTLLGEDLSERSVRLPGGILGERGLVIPGLPKLDLGEDVLLFLSEEGEAGFCMPVGLAQGKLTVETHPVSGVRSLVRSNEHLEQVGGAGQPVTVAHGQRAVLNYAETMAQIHAALASRSARSAESVEQR